LTQVSTKIYVLNKRETLEADFKAGKDRWKEETDRIITFIERDRNNIYRRRRQVEGFGTIYAEGRMIDLLKEVLKSYELGMYHSTIALCGMTVERICYDFIDFSEILINGTKLEQSEKKELYNVPLRALIDFLNKIKIFSDRSRKLLLAINDKRNSYVHPKMTGNEQKDALGALNTLCNAIEEIFSKHIFTKNSHGFILFRKKDSP